MAKAAGAACLLVGDIDRGGVFASLLGTLELLDADERAMIRAFIVNKFRGDQKLLDPGIEMIRERIHLPCAGVVPYLHDLGLDEEDSVSLEERRLARRVWRDPESGPRRSLRIGVIAFPYMANFTDFDALAAEPSVSLAFVERPEEAAAADWLLLPGSKQTLDDLDWLRRRGFEPAIRNFAGRGGIMGICGGMQMLGLTIEDPEGAENRGSARSERGLGLLPIATILKAEKVTRQAKGTVQSRSWLGGRLDEAEFQGYEIHMGETAYSAGARGFTEIERAGQPGLWFPDGAVDAGGRVAGTYVHGLFAEDGFRHAAIRALREVCGLEPAAALAGVAADRERRIDRLAAHVRRALDMRLIRPLYD
jgi:adenosylcobyric acid synthase